MRIGQEGDEIGQQAGPVEFSAEYPAVSQALPEEELQPSTTLIQNVMENAFVLSIPLVTEARSGYNWGEMQTIKL